MIVYKTINKINGKIYIGQDSHNNPKYLGSGVVLNNAIKKYGKENFIKEILCECKTKEELNEREIYYIKQLNSQNKKVGYNISNGGDGGDNFTNNPNKEQIRNKYKQSNKGKTPWNKGKHISEKTKLKISKKLIGRVDTIETRNKKSLAHIGVKQSDFQKQQISKSLIGNKCRVGCKHSDETKRKMQLIKLGKKATIEAKLKMSEKQKGKNNPRYYEYPIELQNQILIDYKNKISKRKIIKKYNISYGKLTRFLFDYTNKINNLI